MYFISKPAHLHIYTSQGEILVLPFNFKREVFLGEVTDGDHNTCSEDLGENGIPVEHLNEKFQQYIIQEQAENKKDEVAEELDPAFDIGFTEHEVFVEYKTKGQVYTERNKECHTVGFKGVKPQVEDLFFQDIAEHDGKNQQAYHRIAAAAGRIAEGLQGHELAERRIKRVDNADQKFSHSETGSEIRIKDV